MVSRLRIDHMELERRSYGPHGQVEIDQPYGVSTVPSASKTDKKMMISEDPGYTALLSSTTFTLAVTIRAGYAYSGGRILRCRRT